MLLICVNYLSRILHTFMFGMNAHLLIVKAETTKTFEILNKVYQKKEIFIQSVEALESNARISLLTSFLLENQLVVPFSAKTQLLFIPNNEIQYLRAADSKPFEIYTYIEQKLIQEHALTIKMYRYYRDRLAPVYIFTEDLRKISKAIKANLSGPIRQAWV